MFANTFFLDNGMMFSGFMFWGGMKYLICFEKLVFWCKVFFLKLCTKASSKLSTQIEGKPWRVLLVAYLMFKLILHGLSPLVKCYCKKYTLIHCCNMNIIKKKNIYINKYNYNTPSDKCMDMSLSFSPSGFFEKSRFKHPPKKLQHVVFFGGLCPWLQPGIPTMAAYAHTAAAHIAGLLPDDTSHRSAMM